MEDNDIKAIVETLLSDYRIQAENIHYDIAIDYYREHGNIPDVNNIINMSMQNTGIQSNVVHIMGIIQTGGSEYNDEHYTDDEEENDEENDEENNEDNEDEESEQNNIGFPIENIQMRLIAENSNRLDVKKVIKDIDTIPLFMYQNSNGTDECPLCYDKFVSTDLVRTLPCSHMFHRICIDEYLKTQSFLCPYCEAEAGDYVYYNI